MNREMPGESTLRLHVLGQTTQAQLSSLHSWLETREGVGSVSSAESYADTCRKNRYV